MRKIDIINAVSHKTGMHKVDVITSFEAILQEIKSSLVKEQNVYLRGFGSFVLKTRKAKIGRNIRQNYAVAIPEKIIVSLKPSPELLEELNKNHQTIASKPAEQQDLVAF